MNIFNKVRKLAQKKYILPVVVSAAVAVPALVYAGFGPTRPVFDWNNPADRKGSMTGPVFNSFINTPTYGDERNFVRVAPVVNGQSPVEADFAETNTAEAGKEYWVRTFVHNNANQSTNGANLDGPGVAKNTRVSVEIAQGVANGVDVLANITADNATPKKVWDTATLVNTSKAFSVSYVPGSAKIYNPAHQNGLALPDGIVSAAGVPVGYEAMNGNLPGCFEYSAYIYIKVKISSPNLEVNKRVSKLEAPKAADLKEEVSAKVGDTITWRIDYKNVGSDVARNITIRDQIPEGLKLVPGSIAWFDANHQNGEQLQDTALGSGGVNVGNYAVNGNGAIRFRTVIEKKTENCEIVNVAFGRADNVPELRDDAKVVIEGCEVEVPEYSCDALAKVYVGGHAYRFTLNASATNGATIKQYRYNFGDGSDELVTDKNVVEHAFTKPGTYVIAATVDFNVGNQVRSATSEDCKQVVEVPEDKENCPLPGKEHLPVDSPECKEVPVELPKTGAGSIAGIFAATSFAGSIAHRVVYSRRRK